MPLDVGTRCALVPVALIDRFTEALKDDSPTDLPGFIRTFLALMTELGQCEIVTIDAATPVGFDTSDAMEEEKEE